MNSKNIFQKIEGLLFELAGQPMPDNSNQTNQLPSGATSGYTSGGTGTLNYDNVILSGDTSTITTDPNVQPQIMDANASKTLGSLVDLSNDGEYCIDIEVSGGLITEITVSSSTEKQIQLSENQKTIEVNLKKDFAKVLEDLKTEFQTKLNEFGKAAPEKNVKQTPVNLSEDNLTIAQKRLLEARQRNGITI